MERPFKKTLVVVGGGAAGFFCAIHAAAASGLRVLVLEKSNKLLSKVRISGGGRCNVTHACFRISEMADNYPRGRGFLKKAFHQFFTTDTVEWFEKRGVPLKAEADGRMFPVSNSSESIIQCLLNEAQELGVDIQMQAGVRALHRSGDRFRVELEGERTLEADFVVVACGGFPKSEQFNWIRDLGHAVHEPAPSLFTFNLPRHPITKLMGVSVPRVRVKLPGSKLTQVGPLLITHWGFSGPAILKLSAWAAHFLHERQWQFPILINWLPDEHEESLRIRFQEFRNERARAKIVSKNPFSLPHRLWDFLAGLSGISPDMRWADLPAKEQNRFVRNLCAFTVEAKGKTTFKEEFVTAGGVSLDEVDVQTMMSKKMAHLYFVGEILNIDGITGGFNFQNAWTTAFIAAKDIRGRLAGQQPQ